MVTYTFSSGVDTSFSSKLNTNFSEAESNGMVKIATKTASSTDTLEFDETEITSTYDSYMIIFNYHNSAGDVDLVVANGTTTYETSGYSDKRLTTNAVVSNTSQSAVNMNNGAVVQGHYIINRTNFNDDGVAGRGGTSGDSASEDDIVQWLCNASGNLKKLKLYSTGGTNFTDGSYITLYGIEK